MTLYPHIKIENRTVQAAAVIGLGLLIAWLIAAALALMPVVRHLQKARP